MLSALNKSNFGSQLLYLNISSRSVPGLGLGPGLHGAWVNINLETRRADMWRYVDHFIISGFWIICCDTNNPVNVLTVPPLPPPACPPCQDHFFTDSISASQFTDNKLLMQVLCPKAGLMLWPRRMVLVCLAGRNLYCSIIEASQRYLDFENTHATLPDRYPCTRGHQELKRRSSWISMC